MDVTVANLRTIQRSFAGGEMSPSMLARVDDIRFQNGYASARNFEVLPNGSARRRPGLRHVRRCKYNDKRCRLIPFKFSIDSTIQIETGHLYFRFHQNGGTLLYATPRVVQSIDTAANTIRFTARHGLANEMQVQFTSSTRVAGDLPDPLDPMVTYYVTVVDAKTVTVSTTTPAGAAVNLTDAGAGTIRMWLNSEMPIDWFVSRNFVEADVNVGTDVINLATAHGFSTADAVQFTSTGTLPTATGGGLNVGEAYYVIVASPSTIKLARSAALAQAGTAIDLLTDGSAGAVHKIHRLYEPGALVYSGISGHGVFYCYLPVASDTVPIADTAHWYVTPDDGVYEIPSPYLESNLEAITYDQKNDIVKLSHDDHSPRELRRGDSLRWLLATITLAPQLAAPVIGTVTRTFGAYQVFDASVASPSVFVTASLLGHGLVVGDSVYVESVAGGIGGAGTFAGNAADYYEVAKISGPSPDVQNSLLLKTVNGGSGVAVGVGGVQVYMRYVTLLANTTQSYKVTAVTDAGLESTPSAAVTATNNLSAPGASNLVSWSEVTGAARYHVYKLEGSAYGWIGQSDAGSPTFKDDFGGLAPDMSRTLGFLDTTLGAAGKTPAAVTSFEQRVFFGGTDETPNGVWATRTGTLADLSYHIPVLDDDRLRFNVDANEAVSIRHFVPMRHLLVLTNSTEFRILPVDSDVLTPSSIDVKAHSYKGCSRVRPTVVGSNLVFCAARGGHVYEMGYQQNGVLSEPGDMCLRAEHLFDGESILDQSYAQSPQPNLWFCSSSGRLLGLTYVPQESIGAWHVHDTAASGAFESCGVTAEGDEDARYFVVRRTINGSVVRSVEMMAAERHGSLTAAYFVDAGGSFDGTYDPAGGTTMTVTGGTTWAYGDAVTITASTIQFVLGSDDVGDHVALIAANGTAYRIRITAVSTNATATGTLLGTLPLALRGVATTSWAFARDTIAGLDHLEGQTVQVFGDGLVQATRVVTGGAITPASPAIAGCVGLAMPTSMRLLPIGLQTVEAWGQGRTKNVNQAALRVVESGPFLIGPSAISYDDLVPANAEAVPGSLVTGESRVALLPEWTDGGQITVRIDDPLPLTLLGIVMQVALGD